MEGDRGGEGRRAVLCTAAVLLCAAAVLLATGGGKREEGASELASIAQTHPLLRATLRGGGGMQSLASIKERLQQLEDKKGPVLSLPPLEGPGNSSGTVAVTARASVEVTCFDSIADGRAGCFTPECDRERSRFHLPVGTEVTVICPGKCSTQHDAAVYGPGDGTKSEERCSGYGQGAPGVFADVSSICRAAIAMRALGALTPGIVTFKITEPVRSYPRCDDMPHATPGMPFGTLYAMPTAKFQHKISSATWVWHDWAKADRPAFQDRWGGPEKCCFDSNPPNNSYTAEPCCAIMKYRQRYHAHVGGLGYWWGVRGMEIVSARSQNNIGITSPGGNAVRASGEESLGVDSGYAAVPGGSAQLKELVREGLTVEAWVSDSDLRPNSSYVAAFSAGSC